MPATDAAKRLGKSREAVVRLCQRGGLDGQRDLTGKWQVTVASVEAYLRAEAKTLKTPRT